MKRVNKYLYLWIVQGYYGSLYGWEDLTAEDSYSEGRKQLKVYRQEEPEYNHRLIQRRELNPEYHI